MTRKPLFWILLLLASAGGVLFSVTYFSEAFPIVTLDLRMDRSSALGAAKDLAGRLHLGPANYEQAASFAGEQEVQVFVELEAGGTQAFQEMMQKGLYMPYTWSVRHYKPGEVKEARFVFTPDGKPYGFSVRLPEKDPGAALTPEEALSIALREATDVWGIDIQSYVLVEQSQEVRGGGRIDHTFVYERPNVKIGEGLYRLRLVVGGNSLTELKHFVKVPEAFQRRYQEMRSANEAIGVASSLSMALLYIVVGCGIGLFYLLRHRWILWRQPLLWGGVLAALQFLVTLNQLPLVWMDYDTAVSVESFLAQQIAMHGINSLFQGIIFAVSFMAAESLSRRAFPHHLQQWRLWSPPVASTKAVLGRTIAGYFLVGVLFAYEVALYFVGKNWLGWWTPSDILFHPDVLATYLPWLTSIGASAQAGFWEESLFRAVPLAGAALLGDRFGGRKWWIAAAMVVQAIIFGGGHAGYANQPAYARVVELIIPSLIFGGIYLAFGLLPSIILHFAFDVVWFALPLFVSTAPGVWVDQLIVIVVTLTPLWVVLAARVRMKRWNEIAPEVLNRSWIPSQAETQAPSMRLSEDQPIVAAVRFVPMIGVIALVVYISLTSFKTNVPPVSISRTEAISLATLALRQQGVELPASWKALTSVAGSPGEDDRFIWQTMGPETYETLVGEYLPPPHWRVRFARFEGDVAERAEEYNVYINGKGEVFRIRHRLPEDRPGSTVGEQEARILAHLALNGLWNIDAASLKEVSAVPSKLKHRTDWLFTFADTLSYRLKEGGEVRIAVAIAGEKVADAYRFVYVPEEWARRERDARALPGIVQTGSTVMHVLIVIAAMIIAVIRWSKNNFSAKTFFVLSGIIFLASIVTVANGFPALESAFSTAQPYSTQVFISVGIAALGLFLLAGSLGLAGGLVVSWKEHRQLFPTVQSWLSGMSLGLLFMALTATAGTIDGSKSPLMANYEPLNTYIPFVRSLVDPLLQVLTRSLILLFVFIGVDRVSTGWQQRRILAGSLLLLYGFILAGSRQPESLSEWVVSGAVVGFLFIAAYVYYTRFDVRVIPAAVGTVAVLEFIRQAIFEAYPEAPVSFALAGVVALAASWVVHRTIVRT
jgi:hypothetical protein